MEESRSSAPEKWGASGVKRTLVLAGVWWWLGAAASVAGVVLTGANGKAVDFAGIKKGGPEGLEVQVAVSGAPVVVPWEKFDLQKMATEAPEVFAAYEKAKTGATTELNLGVFAPKPMSPPAPTPVPAPAVPQVISDYDAEVEISGKGAESGVLRIHAVAVLPPSKKPEAVLILATGESGNSLVNAPRVGGGLWRDFQSKVPVAIVACHVITPSGASLLGIDPGFVHPERGSGDLLLELLAAIGKKLDQKNWTTLPLIVYGHGITGAAWGFNLAQWKPSRMLGVIAAKGAYYATPVTDESLQVPVMFIKGLNDYRISDWKATQPLEEVYEANIARMPNWIFAIDPNGDHRESPVIYRMAQEFVLEIWNARKPGEDGVIPLIDRSRGWVGSLETAEISRLAAASTPLTKDQTWLPSAKFAPLWRDLALGVLPPGEPGQAAAKP